MKAGKRGKWIVSVGPLEAEVLDLLWAAGEELSIRDLYEMLRLRHPVSDGVRPPAYTTVSAVLRNLHGKGYTSRRTKDGRFLYRPRYSRREVLLAILAGIRDSLAGDDELWMEAAKEVSHGR